MSDSDEWMERYYTEQKRLGVMEERNKIAQEKVRNDVMNAQADRDMRYQLVMQQEKERTNREILKTEHEEREKQTLLIASTQKARIEAQNNLDMSDKRFVQDYLLKKQDAELQSKKDYDDYFYKYNLTVLNNNSEKEKQWKECEQSRFLQAREIESKHTMQVNEFTYKLENQKQENEQARYLQSLNLSHELNLKEEERKTYKHNAIVDINAHHHRTAIDIMAYKEKSEIEKDKRINEAFCYHYERAVDAKWKVWIMEQEKRIFGNKQTDEEINEHIKRNREKWDKEI